jgi:hypothetical protein
MMRPRVALLVGGLILTGAHVHAQTGRIAGMVTDAVTLAPVSDTGGVLGDLPVGASLDPSGTFYWQPGPGFAGRIALLFVRTDCQGTEERLPVTVTIQTRMR